MPGATSNFGFEYPLDTDALADGAQEIQNFAETADTTFADLLGGTTGQVLAKNSNTGMDFVWSTLDQPIVTHIAIRTADSSGTGTLSLLEADSDTFAFGLNKQYYVYGQAVISKGSSGTNETITLDFNFSNAAYADISWSFVTTTNGDQNNVDRSFSNLTTESGVVTDATTAIRAYSCVFQGIIRTDATNAVTMTPQIIGSGSATLTLQDFGCFVRVEEWGAKNAKEAGAGGWS